MTSTVRAATITLAGRPATVIQVPSYVVHNLTEAARISAEHALQFPGQAIILAAMAGPRPMYYGDRNLIAALRSIPAFRIHWQDHMPLRPDGGDNDGESVRQARP